MVDKNKYNELIKNMPNAFAYHRIVEDGAGKAVDYIFLEVNTAFEEMTGLKRDNIIGRKVTEVLPGIEKGEFDWIGTYDKVARGGGKLIFEQFSEPQERWYKVHAYSDEPGCFATIFSDITASKNESASMKEMVKLTINMLNNTATDLNYQEIAETLRQLSGAKFAAINTYMKDRTKSVTRAIVGIQGLIDKVSEVLGFNIAGQAWDINPERLRKIEGGKLVRFSSLHETAMGALNKTTSSILHKLTGTGDIYVIELAYGGQETIGDIIFFMPKNKDIANRELIELFSGQLVSLLAKMRLEKKLQENQKKLALAQTFARTGMWEYDINRGTLHWSKECEALFGLEEGEFERTFEAFIKRVHPGDQQYVISMNRPITEYKEGLPFEYEHRIIQKDASVLWVKESAGIVKDENGNPMFITGFVADITGQKLYEAKLQTALEDNKALLRETHHRVKNNLAVIISLIAMQNRKSDDAKNNEVLKTLSSKIYTMALIHEELSNSKKISLINMQKYLNRLIAKLRSTLVNVEKVNIFVEAGNTEMNMETAIPCALIINELVANSLKHAFPVNRNLNPDRTGEIAVTLKQDGDYYNLKVSDNGIGLPADFSLQDVGSTGLRLVKKLGEHQLGGSISIKSDNKTGGTEFILSFRIIH